MKRILWIIFLPGLIFCCSSKPKSLSDQLKTNFLSRLNKVDSTIVLDSFNVIKVDTMDQKMERIIDDTIYKRELVRVQAQLTNAIKEKKEDSIGFIRVR